MGKLGEGSYATVHRARSTKLGDTVVAVKVMDLTEKDPAASDEKRISSKRLFELKEEVSIAARVNGRANVINFYGSFLDGSLSFLIMEKCDSSLLQAIDRLPAITEESVARFLKEMLNGLASIHELGIMHRDVKPDNFLCSGPKDTVKLCDFGLASLIPREGSGPTGIFGTPPFMSPEMLLDRPHDQKTDAWSFGVIVYSLFYGRFPYEPGERTAKAMKKAIRTGIPMPSFSPPASLVSSSKVSGSAKNFAMDLLNRNPDHRISADFARRHHFFACPGKTNLNPMFESSRLFGAFCGAPKNNPARKSDVDRRIESLQHQRKEDALQASLIKVHIPPGKEDFDDCSTHLASGVQSKVSSLQSFDASIAISVGVDGSSPRASASAPRLASGVSKVPSLQSCDASIAISTGMEGSPGASASAPRLASGVSKVPSLQSCDASIAISTGMEGSPCASASAPRLASGVQRRVSSLKSFDAGIAISTGADGSPQTSACAP